MQPTAIVALNNYKCMVSFNMMQLYIKYCVNFLIHKSDNKNNFKRILCNGTLLSYAYEQIISHRYLYITILRSHYIPSFFMTPFNDATFILMN